MNTRVVWCMTLIVVYAVCVQVVPVRAATAVPRAAMVLIASDNNRQIVLDVGDAQGAVETLVLPAQVQAEVLTNSPLPTIVQQLMVPTTTQNFLLFKGEPTATPAPTMTPYVPRARADVRILPGNQLETDMHHPGARFVSLTCTKCAPDWELSVLNQLPDYAPIVVYAPGRVQLPGAWLIHIKSVPGSSLPTFGNVVHLFERLPDQELSALSWRSGRVNDATYPPERLIQVDGRMTLMRIAFCMVAVLFCSIASFYLALAVMRRMHAAVGYKPEQ